MNLARFWPYGLFAAITLGVGGDALFFGRTFHDVRTYRAHLGEQAPPPSGFHAHRPPPDRGDTVLLLPMLFRNYNEGLKHGELRLWNPFLFGGYPVTYDTMLHPFYPPHLVLHLLFPPGLAYSMTLLLHLFFAGTAMYWLCRGLGRTPPASTAAGLIWMLWGYSAHWWSTGILEGVSVFGPLALLALHRGKTALAGLAAGLVILGSHPQHAVLFLIFLASWAVVSCPRRAPLLLAVSVAVGMAALLTRLDSLANGHRQLAGDFEMLYGSPWGVLARASDVTFGKAWFPRDPLVRSEFPVYAGLWGTALAVVGAVGGFRDRRIRFLAIFGGLALLLPLVRPLAALLTEIPFLNYSMPSRWVYLAGLCLAILAADGWDDLARFSGRVPYALGAALALPIVLLVLAPVRLSAVAVAETTAGGLVALGACLTVGRRPSAALVLGLAAILVDLLPPFLHHNATGLPLETSPKFAGDPRAPSRMLGAPGERPADPRPWNLAVGNNLLALHQVEAFAGYEALLPKRYVDYALAAGGQVAGSGRVAWFDRFDSPLVAAAGVGRLANPFGLDPPPGWRPLSGTVYENPGALPRARFVQRALPARDWKEASRLIRSTGFDPATEIVLEAPPPPIDTANGDVVWLDRSTDRMTLRTTSTGRALLVLADTWDEGWEAHVDGQPVPIFCANVMFRAVAVPPGQHEVSFRFRPSGARLGFLVTLISMAAVGAWSLRSVVARRRKGGILPTGSAL